MEIKFSIHHLLILLCSILVTGCETEYVPDTAHLENKLIVEGYIEAGENPLPAYVILTKSFQAYGTIGADVFDSSYVHDATITVSDGVNSYPLTEVCLLDLPLEIRKEVAPYFGLDGDSLIFNFCVYIDIAGNIQAKEGGVYHLTVQTGTEILTATTTIPPIVELSDFKVLPPPGMMNDTLAQLDVFIDDPAGVKNNYRYLASINGSGYTPGFASVVDDQFFDGKGFTFSLSNPTSGADELEDGTFGLYTIGDSVSIKWCTIDNAHYDFWNSLEFSRANQGPFSTYTRIQSNIQGGLGIWGGYNVRYYNLRIEK